MIYVALILSIINSLLWIVFAVAIRRVFKKLVPFFSSLGITGSQNLMYSGVYDKMGEPPELADAKSDK